MTENKKYTMADGDYPPIVVYNEEEGLSYFEVIDKLNNQEEKIKDLQKMIDTIRRQCEPFRIPLTLTAFIPTEENCKRYNSCHGNHMTNAQSYGQSRMANKILKVINGDDNGKKS